MAKTTDDIINDILIKEGGYVNHPADKGGPTNHGITQKTLSEWLGRPASIADVKALSRDEARQIYRQRYVAGPKIDTLPPVLRPSLADMSVNHGPARAVKILQTTLRGAGLDVSVDGVIGPQTRKASETIIERWGNIFVNRVVNERVSFYLDICRRDPTQNVFLRGWLKRAESFRVV